MYVYIPRVGLSPFTEIVGQYFWGPDFKDMNPRISTVSFGFSVSLDLTSSVTSSVPAMALSGPEQMKAWGSMEIFRV